MATLTLTTAELSWLLAGRDSDSARFARRVLGLDALADGDQRVIDGAQSLVARGLATVEGDGVVTPTATVTILAFTLSTAHDWVQLTAITDGSAPEVLFTVGAPGVEVFFILRLRPLGTIEVMVSRPGAHPSHAIGPLVETYVRDGRDPRLGIVRGIDDETATTLIAHGDAHRWQVMVRRRVAGLPDVELGAPIDVSAEDYLQCVADIIR